MPRRFNEWPEFTSTRDSPVCDAVRSTGTMYSGGGWLYGVCYAAHGEGRNTVSIAYGRKCVGRVYTDTRGRGVPIMRCQPYYGYDNSTSRDSEIRARAISFLLRENSRFSSSFRP